MNAIEAISVGKIFDENSIAVTEVEIVTTSADVYVLIRSDATQSKKHENKL